MLYSSTLPHLRWNLIKILVEVIHVPETVKKIMCILSVFCPLKQLAIQFFLSHDLAFNINVYYLEDKNQCLKKCSKSSEKEENFHRT